MATRTGWVVGLLVSLTFGCSESSNAPARLVVTADWLNRSLSVFDYEKLTNGQSTASAALLRTIDLADWSPDPPRGRAHA